MSPSDRRAQMLSILADAVEVGRRLSASPPPRLHERMGTPARRRRLLAATGGVIGALVAATGAVHALGGPDQPVLAPYTPPATTAASAADTGAYPDPAGLSGVQPPRIAVATRPPLPLPVRVVPAGLGPSHARSPVHRVVAPRAAAPLPPPPPQVVAGPMVPQPPTASPVPPPPPPSPPPTPAPSSSASPR